MDLNNYFKIKMLKKKKVTVRLSVCHKDSNKLGWAGIFSDIPYKKLTSVNLTWQWEGLRWGQPPDLKKL